MTTPRPFQIGPEGGRAIWHMGTLIRFRAVGADTGGQYWLAEQVSDKGYASPLHRHTREDELFVMLDGEIALTVAEREMTVRAGDIAFAPRGLPHSFRVDSPTARFLVLTTPAGFEQWFFETGTAAAAGSQPPPFAGPPDVAALVASLARYDVELIGPPQ
jgi:quercetin dioxygenase-like cupin family protein